jgi:hypothetical protein
MQSTFVDIGKASDLLNITPQQVRNLCRDKKIPSEKVAGRWVLYENDVNNYYDRSTSYDDAVNQGYAIDWDNVVRTGQVNLRTIFYTPIDQSSNFEKPYSLKIKSTGNDPTSKFYNSNNGSFSSGIVIGNDNEFSINKLEDLFTAIENRNICVTNSNDGTTSEFWWNPAKIYSTESFSKAEIEASSGSIKK